ncbi:MAG: hypothetical protein SVX38_03830 [Chloroflexota bacterium]|nr:hypothetical protein [Chloroflexota bacterium]
MPTCLSCKREYLTDHLYCRECGVDNTTWFIQRKICPRCGAELRTENLPKARCPRPGCKAEAIISYQELPDGRLVCRKCGTDSTDHFTKLGICPRCGAEQISWNPDNTHCPRCGAGGTIAYQKEEICPFCGADNSGARVLSARGEGGRLLHFFGTATGILAMLFALAPLITPFLRSFLGPYINVVMSMAFPVFLSLLLIFLTYSMKNSLRDYLWSQRVKKRLRPPLTLIMALSLVAALMLTGLFVVTYKNEGSSSLRNSLLYSGIFIFFSLAFILATALQYANYLDGTMRWPEPIFAQEDRLVRVITESAQRKLGDKAPLYLLEMERTPAGGAEILFAHYGDPEYRVTKNGDPITVQEERKWLLTANEYGNIVSLREKGLQRLTEIKKSPGTALQIVEG